MTYTPDCQTAKLRHLRKRLMTHDLYARLPDCQMVRTPSGLLAVYRQAKSRHPEKGKTLGGVRSAPRIGAKLQSAVPARRAALRAPAPAARADRLASRLRDSVPVA